MPKITVHADTMSLVKRLDALADALQAVSVEARALAVIIGREDAKRMMAQFYGVAKGDNETCKPTP
jgi:hypothetical protein